MNLADIVKRMRDEASTGPGEQTRADWQASLVKSALDEVIRSRLLKQAAKAWLVNVARDITASILKPSGIMPRVPAGQIALWPDMVPVAGREALRAYARKYRHVVVRYALAIRLLGYLDVAYENDAALAKEKTLLSALVSAGASAEDIANLREIAKVSAAA